MGKLTQTTAEVQAILNKADALPTAVELDGDLADKADLTALIGMYPTDEATGATASFTDGADGIPVKDLKIEITPVQAGSGDPTPDNVRPITGFTGANIVVSPTLNAQDGTTYAVSWQTEAGTVYGGELDVTTGELTVTHAIIDLGTLNWGYSSLYQRFYATISAIKSFASGSTLPNMYCSAYTLVTANAQEGDVTLDDTISQASKAISVRDLRYTDPATFKTAVSGVKVVYELATPVSYELDPVTDIVTLLGQNNIWSDTGDTDVTYRADIALYIDKKIAEATA